MENFRKNSVLHEYEKMYYLCIVFQWNAFLRRKYACFSLFFPELERDKCYNCLIFAFYLHICKKSSTFAAKLD